MKKFVYIAFLSLGLAFTSCEKEEVGSTATEATAGQWYVNVSAVDDDNSLMYTDDELFGLGNFMLLTYNTSDNKPNEMFVDDLGTFWEFKCKVNCDQQKLTFATDGVSEDIINGCGVTITEGKILKGAATTPSGMPADSISFYVNFDDDEDYGNGIFFAKYHVAGFRYTGLAADE